MVIITQMKWNFEWYKNNLKKDDYNSTKYGIRTLQKKNFVIKLKYITLEHNISNPNEDSEKMLRPKNKKCTHNIFSIKNYSR